MGTADYSEDLPLNSEESLFKVCKEFIPSVDYLQVDPTDPG